MTAFPRRAGPPVAEPLTLAETLLHLREDAGVSDARINTLISVARETCEKRTERTMLRTPWRLTVDSFPAAFKLLQPPIIEVLSVQFLDQAGVQQTLDPSDYRLDNVSEPGYLVPAFGRSWPDTLEVPNAVVVNYAAGYGIEPGDVPAPLRQWMLLAVGEMYATRNASAEKPMVRHSFVDGLLDFYRMVGI